MIMRPAWSPSGDGLVSALILLAPVGMLAGFMWPPEATYGPSAALSAWFPLAAVVMASPFVTQGARIRRAMRPAAPFLAAVTLATVSLLWAPDRAEGLRVIAHLAAPLVVYLAAWRIRRDEVHLGLVGSVAAATIGSIGVLFVASWLFHAIDKTDLMRLMGITSLALPPLFVLATIGKRSATYALVVGGAAIWIALTADTRMVGLVLAVLLITSPALGVSLRSRVTIAAAGVLLVLGLASLDALDGRILGFDSGGSVSGVLEPGADLLGDRPSVWGSLLERCDTSWLVGNGVGASNVWAPEIDRNFPEPHNAFVQSFCDLGLAGAGLLWWFFLACGVRAVTVVVSGAGDREFGVAALQMLGALLMLSLTDIPLTASAQFLIPVAVVLGWADARSWAVRWRPASVLRRSRTTAPE
jgi:hypothetical protein